ncbi:uncharacterized protein LOC122288879 isoform X1 [Carya illinoinensis]|uniref:uncharacterized protein LOC122288879 isoform X1 n=1 Tax=Carya illinoinensis TaxID=32201 RepID=UPI001C721AC3|nr:uncharacterized protein LOC122288879 isoform X1 [Carya illinoinensis]
MMNESVEVGAFKYRSRSSRAEKGRQNPGHRNLRQTPPFSFHFAAEIFGLYFKYGKRKVQGQAHRSSQLLYTRRTQCFASVLLMVAVSGSSSRPRTFKREEVREDAEEESEEEIEKEEEPEKRKGTLGLIEIENPNLVKPKNLKAGNVDMKKTTELSRRERVSESASTPINGHLKDFKCNLQACSLCNSQSKKKKEEIEKKRAHERYMRLQEQGKTEQARKDIERLALIRQQRAEAARKRGEEKAAKEQKKGEARKAEIKKKPSI